MGFLDSVDGMFAACSVGIIIFQAFWLYTHCLFTFTLMTRCDVSGPEAFYSYEPWLSSKAPSL